MSPLFSIKRTQPNTHNPFTQNLHGQLQKSDKRTRHLSI